MARMGRPGLSDSQDSELRQRWKAGESLNSSSSAGGRRRRHSLHEGVVWSDFQSSPERFNVGSTNVYWPCNWGVLAAPLVGAQQAGRFIALLCCRITLFALSSGLDVLPKMDRSPKDLDKALASLAKQNASALVVLGGGRHNSQTQEIAQLAAVAKLPPILPARPFVVAGGLLSYGPATAPKFRLAASYVGKIVERAKPDDLPVEQPITARAWMVRRDRVRKENLIYVRPRKTIAR